VCLNLYFFMYSGKKFIKIKKKSLTFFEKEKEKMKEEKKIYKLKN